MPLELLQDTDLSLITIAPHRSFSYPEYLSPTWDEDTQRAVVWMRLQEHCRLANCSLAKVNKCFRTLHQEAELTQAESSHELLSHDIKWNFLVVSRGEKYSRRAYHSTEEETVTVPGLHRCLPPSLCHQSGLIRTQIGPVQCPCSSIICCVTHRTAYRRYSLTLYKGAKCRKYLSEWVSERMYLQSSYIVGYLYSMAPLCLYAQTWWVKMSTISLFQYCLI